MRRRRPGWKRGQKKRETRKVVKKVVDEVFRAQSSTDVSTDEIGMIGNGTGVVER